MKDQVWAALTVAVMTSSQYFAVGEDGSIWFPKLRFVYAMKCSCFPKSAYSSSTVHGDNFWLEVDVPQLLIMDKIASTITICPDF